MDGAVSVPPSHRSTDLLPQRDQPFPFVRPSVNLSLNSRPEVDVSSRFPVRGRGDQSRRGAKILFIVVCSKTCYPREV